MIKFDFNTYNNFSIDNYDLTNLENKFVNDNMYTDWYNLEIDTKKIKECAKEVRNDADVFIVLGIGGSSLGAQAVICALKPYFDNKKPEILFVGTSLSTDYITNLLEYIKDKSIYINFISKSGSTFETVLTYNILLDYMKQNYSDYSNRIIITSANKELLEKSQKEGYRIFEMSENTVGRFSVLSVVGLFPIAVAGFDIDRLICGALSAKEDKQNVYKYTCIRNKMLNCNKFVESFDAYEPKLYYFTEWLKQLFGETQGKNNSGILPVSTVNTRDLHSLGQFYQEGNPIIFSTAIFAKSSNNLMIKKYNSSLDNINSVALYSVLESRYNHMNTNLIVMDGIDEYNLGYLIFFFERSAMLGSFLLNINYYDQPGVNGYKQIMSSKLNG